MLFTKMQGAGNDFIIVNGFSYQSLGDAGALAKKMCDRHYGAGADGLIWLCPSPVAAANVRIFNSDGSEAETCGNGVRCAAKYLYDSGLAKSGEMRLQTLAGIISARVDAAGVTVDMGVPRFDAREIPVRGGSNVLTLPAGEREAQFFCVSMGNPHAVTFDLYPDDKLFYEIAPALEANPVFPNGRTLNSAAFRTGASKRAYGSAATARRSPAAPARARVWQLRQSRA